MLSKMQLQIKNVFSVAKRKIKNAAMSTDVKEKNQIKNIITGIHPNYLYVGIIVAVVLF